MLGYDVTIWRGRNALLAFGGLARHGDGIVLLIPGVYRGCAWCLSVRI